MHTDMAHTEHSQGRRRLRAAAALAAAACAVGLTAVVVRQDAAQIGSALSQYTSFGPGGEVGVPAQQRVHWEQLQVRPCPPSPVAELLAWLHPSAQQSPHACGDASEVP